MHVKKERVAMKFRLHLRFRRMKFSDIENYQRKVQASSSDRELLGDDETCKDLRSTRIVFPLARSH